MRNILQNTVLISLLTFASRVLGVIRDAVIAMIFGITFESDAFFIAFRPFDLIRKLFSEGMLSISFVPAFTRTYENKGPEKAMALAFSFFAWLSAASVILMFSAVVFAPYFSSWIFKEAAGSWDLNLTLMLFKIMVPYIWLILSCAVCMGILNSLGQFGLPALAPVLFNLVVICFVVICAQFFDAQITFLAFGVVAGGIVQLAVQLRPVLRLVFAHGKKIVLFDARVIQIIKVMVPCMIGAGSYQINIMVASFFAADIAQGSISSLYYADRMVQFPMALFVVSTATVFLPKLSKMVSMGRLEESGLLFSNGVKLNLFITLPAMAGLMVLDHQIITLLFGRGQFDQAAVDVTADCLFWLASGLWAFTLVRLFATFYYAMDHVRTPFSAGLISIVLNFCLCLLSPDSLGLKGLIFCVWIASTAGVCVMCSGFRRICFIDGYGILVSACRSVFLSGIMALLVGVTATVVPDPTAGTAWFAFGTIVCIGTGVLFYFASSWLISSPEISLLKKALGKKINDIN